jgi:hypothetical protein
MPRSLQWGTSSRPPLYGIFPTESQKYRTLRLGLSVCSGSSQRKHAWLKLSVAVDVGSHVMYRSCLNPPSSNGFRRGLISCIDLFDDDHAETMAALEAMTRHSAPNVVPMRRRG